ncbi:MAG: TrkA family potassium uptake protein, partial [Actinomycetota bacterium]
HTVAVIDKNQRRFERLPPGFEGLTYVGLVFDRETLEAAGIKEAGAYIAVTNGDNSNILSARVAREAYNVEKVVARIYDPRRAEIYRRLGIPTVASVQWTSGEIYDMLFHGFEHAEMAFGGGEMILLRLDVPANLAGRQVDFLNEAQQANVVAVDRMGTATIPAAKATFQEGDVVHIVIRRDGIPLLREKMAALPEEH